MSEKIETKKNLFIGIFLGIILIILGIWDLGKQSSFYTWLGWSLIVIGGLCILGALSNLFQKTK
jgi:hypothetical protein